MSDIGLADVSDDTRDDNEGAEESTGTGTGTNNNNEDNNNKPTQQQRRQQQPPAFNSKALTAWQEYYDSLGVDRKKEIEKYGKKLEYEVFQQPVYDDNRKLIHPDEIRVFKRLKISTKDYLATEKIRVQMKTTKDPDKQYKLLVQLYKDMSFYYLQDKETGERMTEEQFYRCDWVQIKNILDGANLHSTMGTLPLETTK